MVHLRVTRESREEVAPILWEDNYFSLLPGESRTVGARYEERARGGRAGVLQLEGFNVTPASEPIEK
jgi:exo-1,4-beta-D-glucosaminidase